MLAGLIIAASVLVAAGIAVYENPQVQEWVEKTRRKIAIAIYSLDHNGQPTPSQREKEADAVAAARKKRDEVMTMNRDLFVNQQQKKRMQEQSRHKPSSANGTASFDDFLKGDGAGAYMLHNTSAEPMVGGPVPRRRTKDDRGLSTREEAGNGDSAGQAAQLLFDADAPVSEMNVGQETNGTRESSATLSGDEAAQMNPLSDPEPLIRIGSEPHSGSSSVLVTTPTSTSSLISAAEQVPSGQPSSTYFSIDEWAENTTSSCYAASPNATQAAQAEGQLAQSAWALSDAGSGEYISGTVSVDGDGNEGTCSDIISDTSGMHTPGTWTEVGSEVSEGDVGGQ